MQPDTPSKKTSKIMSGHSSNLVGGCVILSLPLKKCYFLGYYTWLPLPSMFLTQKSSSFLGPKLALESLTSTLCGDVAIWHNKSLEARIDMWWPTCWVDHSPLRWQMRAG